MTEIERQPPNLLRFLGMEEENVLVSIATMREEMEFIARLEGLYAAAMTKRSTREDDVVIWQLLTFSHYHFLHTLACQMRCHLSEAFASTRAAIDAALVAAYIIKDRAAQVAYAKREKPFDNFARHLGNMIKDEKPLPHPLMETLIGQQKIISTFAAHADIGSFVHRVTRLTDETGVDFMNVEYFQFAHDEDERKLHTLSLIHSYVMVLDVFSDFLIIEQKVVPEPWKVQLHALGQKIERRAAELQTSVRARQGPNKSGRTKL